MTEGKHRGRSMPVRQGPDRWLRAALNAAREPNSQAAQLYLARTSNAFTVTQEAKDSGELEPLTPFAFRERGYGGDPHEPVKVKREQVTCSVYCTVMQIQLKFGTTDLGKIRDTFSAVLYGTDERIIIQLDKGDLVRPVKCAVCGSRVRPAGK